MIKLCPHVQTLPGWLNKRRNRVEFPGEWVKVIDPGRGIQKQFLGKKILGRWYVKDEGQYIRRGAVGADDYYKDMAKKYEECRDDLAAIESVNEPGCEEPEQVEQLNAFLCQWIALMHNAEPKLPPVAVPAFSVWHPTTATMRRMSDVWRMTDYWTLHEYGITKVNEEWCEYTSLRHRMLAYAIQDMGIKVPPLLITEAGIDRGGAGYRHKPGQTQWRAYMDQLLWYEAELQRDAYVEAAFVFTSGATPSWKSFDVGEGEWNDLAKALR